MQHPARGPRFQLGHDALGGNHTPLGGDHRMEMFCPDMQRQERPLTVGAVLVDRVPRRGSPRGAEEDWGVAKLLSGGPLQCGVWGFPGACVLVVLAVR